MRAVAYLLAVLFLAGGSSAVVAQDKHVIDPMLPGSLNPEPLPPLKNPDAPSTPAKELFARKSTPYPGTPRSIGGDFDGCSLALCRCRSLVRPGKSCGRRVTATGAIRNSFASSNGLPRTREKLAGTVFWLATCLSRAGGRCCPSTPAIKSASTSILVCADAGPRAEPRGARIRPGHRCGLARSARRRSGSMDPQTYCADPNGCARPDGRPHFGQCGDQEGAMPRGRS